jgi:heat-inducible transcriptional repressor
VASATLTQKYKLGVSSATVRNELADLEASGYLVQPHTSAGRIPSDAGYRTFVDQLMHPESLRPDDRRRIRDELRDASRELDEIIDGATRLLGKLSKNLAFATKPSNDAQTFRHLQLIWLSARTGMAIVVTSMGVASQSLFELAADATPDELTRLSNALNSRLGNKMLRDIREADVAAALRELGLPDEFKKVVTGALRSARSGEQAAVATSGAQNLLDQPEFHDVGKLRSILNIVEEQKTLYDLVADSMTAEAPEVKIGRELGVDEMIDFSIVTVPYRFGASAIGMLSVLGPRRMPYARLMALASGTAESLSSRLSDAEIK